MPFLTDLPHSVLIEVLTFLVGQRRKNFSNSLYRSHVISLFRADPQIWKRLKENFEFHLAIRGAIEENILSQLQDEPSPVDPTIHVYTTAVARQIWDYHN